LRTSKAGVKIRRRSNKNGGNFHKVGAALRDVGSDNQALVGFGNFEENQSRRRGGSNIPAFDRRHHPLGSRKGRVARHGICVEYGFVSRATSEVPDASISGTPLECAAIAALPFLGNLFAI